MNSVIDALLLPRSFYKTMSVSKRTFFYSVCIVGVLLLCYPFMFENFTKLFIGRSLFEIIFNAGLTIILIFLLGILETIVFCLPVTDLFKFISNKVGGGKDRHLFLKFVKIYTIGALIINPVYILLMNTVFKNIDDAQSSVIVYAYLAAVMLIQFWVYGILCRGLCILLRFKGIQKWLVFTVICIWAQVWGYVYQHIFQNFIIKCFIM